SGRYLLENEDMTSLDDRRQAALRRHKIGFIFQFFHLVPRMTAAENVELPMMLAGVDRKERKERVARAICTAHPEAMRKELLKRERRLLLAPHSREVRATAPENDLTGVLHDWCGTQPSEIRLRLIALENELSWQRSLVREAMEMLRACGVGALADNLASLSRQGPREREHDEYACACADEREPPYAGREEYADSFPW
ncbi:MAG: hypothetical protein LPK92_04745, partial [Actinomycetes bacterium]|nr:hypothetical protein [Actinomycetes bacterium]